LKKKQIFKKNVAFAKSITEKKALKKKKPLAWRNITYSRIEPICIVGHALEAHWDDFKTRIGPGR